MTSLSNAVPALYEVEAQRASLTCFLNSLLREWGDWEQKSLPFLLQRSGSELDAIFIPLQKDEGFWIPLKRLSPLGRHEYDWPIYRQTSTGVFEVIDFHELTDGLIDKLGSQGSVSSEKFRSRVQESLIAVREVLIHRSIDLKRSQSQEMTFQEAEQYLVVGHSFHPSPKSREGFTADDRLRFCPEYAGHFALSWFAVDAAIVRQVSSKRFEDRDWVGELVDSDSAVKSLRAKLPKGFLLYPMHPWQAGYLRSIEAIQAYLDEGRIVDLGEEGEDWYPTSSVRAIYRRESPYMLKTSLNVRLTNSVRSLLLREVDRGLQAHDVFGSRHGQALLARYPQFRMIYEPAYWGIIDSTEEVINESIVICRENPFSNTLGSQSEGLVLASLTQDNPFFKMSPIEWYLESLQRESGLSGKEASDLWFARYCSTVVEPLLMAQADYGILLGAHQQNILVAMKGFLPETLYFRDCQGTGYSELAYQEMRQEIYSLDPANGNILPHEMANTLFVYYLLINATFNVISTIARAGHLSESAMIDHLRRELLRLLASNPRDPSCILHLLKSETILHKGNFICSLKDINENTSENPLAIYTAIANPFYSEAHV